MKNILQNTDECRLTGIYRAYVVDDEDPRDVGRIKVRVPGIYLEDVPTEHLPWALPATGVYRSGGGNVSPDKSVAISSEDLKTAFNKTGTGGIFCVPARGNHVWIWFDNGNHMHPIYFASQPNEDDWIQQKSYLKGKLNTKLQQIRALSNRFTPESGVNDIQASDWADRGFVNARQNLLTEGENLVNKSSGDIGDGTVFTGSKLDSVSLNIGGENMTESVKRSRGTAMTMDVKPLLDKETGKKDKKDAGVIEKGGDTGKNINRYVYSFTTLGGTTILIDNREGQENYYLIHKNYLENIDQNGSRKVFIGRNDPNNANDDIQDVVRSSDELAVDGDKKIHVLGDFVTYAKGNILTQCDKNMQIDINDSCGIRIKKGDFDIIIEGSIDTSRDNESDRDNGKKDQTGDLNIDVKDGKLQLHVKENANIHVEGQCNIKADNDLRMTTLKDFHLHIGGSYHEYIEKNKFSTVKGRKETYVEVEEKRYVGGSVREEFKGNYDQIIGSGAEYKITGDRSYHITGSDTLKIGSSQSTKIGSSMSVEVPTFGIKGQKFGTTCDTNLFNGAVDVGNTLKIAGKTSIRNELHVIGTAYGADFISPVAGLNKHQHRYIDSVGQSGTPTNKQTLSTGLGNGNASPDSTSTISVSTRTPTDPESAKNDGGGPNKPSFANQREVDYPNSDPEINQTDTAKRSVNSGM